MNFSIGQKLGAVVALLALLAAAQSAFTIWQTRLQLTEREKVESHWDFALQARGLAQAVEHVVVVADHVFISDSKDEVKQRLGTLRAALADLDAAHQAFAERAEGNISPEAKTRLALDMKDFISYQNDVVNLGTTISPQAALIEAEDDATIKNRQKMVGRMGDLVRATLDSLAAERAANDQTARRIEIAMFAVPASVIAIGSLIAMWVLGTQVRRPLKQIIGAMQRVAAGELSGAVPFANARDELGELARALAVFKEAATAKARLEADAEAARRDAEQAERARQAEKAEEARQDQFAFETLAESLERLAAGDLIQTIDTAFGAKTDHLRLDFNASIEKLKGTMLTIVSGIATIETGSDDVSNAADELLRRSEKQAANLEETATALEQITATVRKTAEGADRARRIVAASDEDAKQSSEVVRQAIEAMSGIEASSRRIGQIVAVIDEIAFQTNLLALNAGVEAARAGQAGRGFAVVASEVRALASRSAEAASEIKQLISTSTQKVDKGVALVTATGARLTRILAQVAEINAVVNAIATGASAQAKGVEEIGVSVNHMDKVTQQNVEMVDKLNGATQSLKREVTRLSGLIGQFEVGRPVRSPAVGVSIAEAPRPSNAAQGLGRRRDYGTTATRA